MRTAEQSKGERMNALLAAGSPLDHVVQHPYLQTEVGGWTVTVLSNHIVMLIAAAVVLILVFPAAARRRRGQDELGSLTPTGMGNFLESICQYLRKEVAEPNLQEYTDRFIPYIWSTFFFILTINLLGLLPLEPTTKWLFGIGIGGTPTGNIWVTATLALCTMVMMVVNGLRLGGSHYLAHFCPGPIALAPLLVSVEIIGLFAKIFALAVRLFANMMAGHILLAVLLSFILSAGTNLGTAGGLVVAVPVLVGSVAIFMLEIFVAFLQAFIFTFLTTLFIGQSIVFHHDDHGEGDHGHAEAAH
jgi:F-type H+-transporting ATPase subunit a